MSPLPVFRAMSAPRPLLVMEHKFWSTQPVPHDDKERREIAQDLSRVGPIEVKTVAEVKPDPYALPDGFEWCEVDVKNNANIQEVYELLRDNYVEDDDAMFRFNYSITFLQWALLPPDYHPDWHIGVRVTKNSKLVAFITGVPTLMHAFGHEVPMTEINFLCVHKKLRSKRLAPVLIKEVTRRVNLRGVWQAAYTAGVVLPSPVTTCRYYHRSLNPKKLIAVKFSGLGPRMTMSRAIKLAKVPDSPVIPGLRPLQRSDCAETCQLLINYLNRFKLHPIMDEHSFSHWFLPRDQVIDCYVVEDPVTHVITDMVSYYTLPSTVLGHDEYDNLKAAYAYYIVPGKHTMVDLMSDTLSLAYSQSFDVFNALDLMDNFEFIKELRFGQGDGNLQYYLFNWQCPQIAPTETGLVLQ